jgi:hypothetical protein
MQGWGQRWSLSNNRQAWPPEVAFESELEQAKKTTNLATGPIPITPKSEKWLPDPSYR